MNETRRATRHKVDAVVHVQNAITGAAMGRLGNLSSDGMMLIATQPVVDDALYQVQFALPDRHGVPQMIEIGIHQQWNAPASIRDQYWAGFRIIDLGRREHQVLDDWLRRHPANA